MGLSTRSRRSSRRSRTAAPLRPSSARAPARARPIWVSAVSATASRAADTTSTMTATAPAISPVVIDTRRRVGNGAETGGIRDLAGGRAARPMVRPSWRTMPSRGGRRGSDRGARAHGPAWRPRPPGSAWSVPRTWSTPWTTSSASSSSYRPAWAGALRAATAGADHDVAEEQGNVGRLASGPGHRAVRPSTAVGPFVDREGQHVGGAGAAHEPRVEVGDRGLVDEDQGELGVTPDPFGVEDPFGQGPPAVEVDRVLGLLVVGDDLQGPLVREAPAPARSDEDRRARPCRRVHPRRPDRPDRSARGWRGRSLRRSRRSAFS